MLPMDLAWRLLKEENIDEGQLTNKDLFDALLHDHDHMHYSEMTDRQKAIIDAKANLMPHLFTEGSEMGENMNWLLFSRSIHESIPDHYYEDELKYLNHYQDAMNTLFPNNEYNDDKTREIEDNGYEEHPEHPHAVAMSQMHPSFANRQSEVRELYNLINPPHDFRLDFQEDNKSEPMDLSWRLLKTPLLPESIKQVSDNRVEAQFQDPKTNQVFPMIAEKDPKFRTMNVGIYPNQPGQNLGAPSGLDAMDMADKDINEDVKEMLGLGLSNAELTETNEDGPYYESDMTWTDPERRRRGYASALYNLVNQLGERKVRPSANQSDEGKQLWRKRMLPKGEPMDLAWQLLKEEM
jgi:ribosomal protein S18 acetylase RimI-like enzyme